MTTRINTLPRSKNTMSTRNVERHRTEHSGWLRAAVLGANDGILSTSSLVLGVAAAHGTHSSVLVAGVAGLVAGAMAMAAGEYVSVHSQADTEKADLSLERAELSADREGEHAELTAIYVRRGLEPMLARQVAEQLMAHDALGAHARDELGISDELRARPIQAALASAASFAVGAAMPLLVAALSPEAALLIAVPVTSLFFLALLFGEPDRQAATLAQGGIVFRPVRHPMLLLRDVMTAIGIGLEGHGGHPRGLWMGAGLSHVGLHTRLLRPRRLRSDATLTSDREIPLLDGRMVLYATRPTTSAQLIHATRWKITAIVGHSILITSASSVPVMPGML